MAQPDRDAPEVDPRVRAAETKRMRTRAALVASADAAFSHRSWTSTRMEDIADAAGVSAATAYNHFPSKHALISAVYAPEVLAAIARAEDDVAADRPVIDALTDQIDALVRFAWRHRGLTAALAAAVLDYTIRVGRAPDPVDDADPRILVPIPKALVILIEHGQSTGQLLPYPPAGEISAILVNLLLIRSINRKDEAPDATAELLRTLLLGALRPDRLVAARGDGTARPPSGS